MRKILIILFGYIILVTGYGCALQKSGKEEILAKINNYEINRREFEAEFKASSLSRTDTLESRKEFLNMLINRKLILQDAQKKGLDKDKDFLRMIERFWEQSLLKLALDKKTQEVSGTVIISEKELIAEYQKMSSQGQTDKPYSQMREQIKWEINKHREAQLMDAWIEELHKKAAVKVNYDLLK
jgi:hypothetical protein